MVNREKDQNTGELILAAAKEVFLQHGYTGARMQQIADKAGINKALLHYYFQTKEQLFVKVFREAFDTFIPKVESILASDIPVIEKVKQFVTAEMDMLLANPELPVFVINEMWKNQEAFVTRMFEGNQPPIAMPQLILQLDAAATRGEIKRVNFIHFSLNLIAMCVFPFLARPMLQFMMQAPDPAFHFMLSQRKEIIHQYIDQTLSFDSNEQLI